MLKKMGRPRKNTLSKVSTEKRLLNQKTVQEMEATKQNKADENKKEKRLREHNDRARRYARECARALRKGDPLPSSSTVNDSAVHREFAKTFRVQRKNVEMWLDFLVIHHPDYQDVVIDQERLSQLSGDDTVIDAFSTVLHDEVDVNEEDIDEENETTNNDATMNDATINNATINDATTNDVNNDTDTYDEAVDGEMQHDHDGRLKKEPGEMPCLGEV